MAHPSYEVEKTYVAEVDGVVTQGHAAAAAGRRHPRGRAGRGAARAKVRVDPRQDRSIVELVIHEGRNRIVRRLLDQVGHPVRRLTRTAIGPVQLRGLQAGELRELTLDELGALLDAARAREPAGGLVRSVAPWRCGRCAERPSSRRTCASTCSSGSPRWCST